MEEDFIFKKKGCEKMNLRQKLVKIRSSIDYLEKTEKGQTGKYVDSAVLLKIIRDSMNENGVLLCPEIIEHNIKMVKAPTRNNKENEDYVAELKMSFVWLDQDTNEKLNIPWFAVGSNMQDPSFAFGSALTYTERYFLLKFFQIPTSKDDPEFFDKKTEETITPEQAKEIKKIITDKGYLIPDIDKIVERALGVVSVEFLKKSKYEDAINILSEMPPKKVKK